jgi:hypothetical protein
MTLPALLLVSVLVGPGGSEGGSRSAQDLSAMSRMSGSWVKDPDRSDDAEAKMRAAFEQMRGRGGRFGGGGRPPGGPPPEGGRGGGMQRGPGRGGPRGGRGPGIGPIPEEIDLTFQEGELHMDDGERVQIFYLDGEKHLRELPNGTKLETVSLVEGGAVHIREKLERGNIDRKLELSPDGETLVLTTTLKMGNMKEPVVIRTVYERSSAGEGL